VKRKEQGGEGTGFEPRTRPGLENQAHYATRNAQSQHSKGERSDGWQCFDGRGQEFQRQLVDILVRELIKYFCCEQQVK